MAKGGGGSRRTGADAKLPPAPSTARSTQATKAEVAYNSVSSQINSLITRAKSSGFSSVSSDSVYAEIYQKTDIRGRVDGYRVGIGESISSMKYYNLDSISEESIRNAIKKHFL